MKDAHVPAAWRERRIEAVLFDLDGTLVDTASDIAQALNRTLGELGWAPLPVNEVTRMIGRGSPILMERAAAARGQALKPSDQAAMLERFFHHYGALEESDESDATLYPGAADTLRTLHGAGIRIAVVTNKQHRFAESLLQRLGVTGWIDIVVGGDSCQRRKPDPLPLVFACQSLGVDTAHALMVGDSINDVRAARAALIPVMCVPYGYNEGQDPRSLACDSMLDSLADLPGLLWPR